jgi:ATP-dependent Clp protease, protease subunit
MVNEIIIQTGLVNEIFIDKKKPIVILVNKFNETSLKDFEQDFNYAINAKQPIIVVKVDSFGGEVYSLEGMLDLIETSKVPVATVMTSKGMSCGSYLTAFGTKGYRYASQHATMMIHDTSSVMWGKYSELISSADEAKRLNDKLFRRLAVHCGYSDHDFFLRQIHDRGHADWFLDAREMKRLNLIDHIGYPKLVTEVKYETKLEL